jgi:hypothetical protein
MATSPGACCTPPSTRKGIPPAGRMLTELKHRIRDTRESPAGYIYLLPNETFGALLRMKPEIKSSRVSRLGRRFISPLGPPLLALTP